MEGGGGGGGWRRRRVSNFCWEEESGAKNLDLDHKFNTAELVSMSEVHDGDLLWRISCASHWNK